MPRVRVTTTFKLIASAIFIIAGVAVLMPFVSGSKPAVRFENEWITVSVHPNLVEVNGLYEYRNPYPVGVMQALAIPLPNDALHTVQDKVMVTAENGGEVKTLKQGGLDVMVLPFLPFECKRIRVNYRQQCKVSNATYILTTTKPWKRPLLSGFYTLTEHDVELVDSNYQTTKEDGAHACARHNFMPEQDWRFAWRDVVGDSASRERK